MGAQAIAGGSGRVKGGLRLRFPLPVPKSEAWTGGRYQTPVFLQRKMTSGRQSGGRAVPEDQKGLSYYRIIPSFAGVDTEAQRREEACPRITTSWRKCWSPSSCPPYVWIKALPPLYCTLYQAQDKMREACRGRIEWDGGEEGPHDVA